MSDEQKLQREPDQILTEEQREEIRAYLNKEIEDTSANAGRQERIERNRVIDRQRMIRPEDSVKNFPWDGAANTVPPLMWTKISSVVSKFVQAILNKSPLFVYKSRDPAFSDHGAAITKLVEKLVDDPNQAGFRKEIWPLEFDKASFGTVFVKVPFEVKERYFTRKNTTGTEKVTQLVRACPKPYVIPFEDFFTRFHWPDIQEAPWIGVRNYLYFHQLKALEAQGFYQDVDMVWGRNQRFDDEKTAAMENIGTSEQYNNQDPNKIFEIYEINMFYDVEGEGFPQDLIIHYEQESNTILRVEYNDLGRRDIVRIPYVSFIRLLYGMGIGDMTSSLQEMIETVFNTSFNSDELSYMGVTVTRQGSGLEFGESIYPGATVSVPNVQEDLNILKFPSATQQAMLLEDKIQRYADQATGASPMMHGQEAKGEGNRIGATGTQLLAAAGNQYLEAFLKLAINGYQEIGELMLLQMVRNRDYVQGSLEGIAESDRILIEEVLNTPVENIAAKFKFSVSLSDIQQEGQQRQEMLVSLFQLFSAFIDKQVQFVSTLSNPQLSQPGFERLQETVMTGFVGLSKIFERILKNFDEEEIEDFLVSYKDMEFILEQLDRQKEEQVEQARTQINAQATGAFNNGLPGGSAGTPAVMGGAPEEGAEAMAGAPNENVGPGTGVNENMGSNPESPRQL
jgi:hypothetical protein